MTSEVVNGGLLKFNMSIEEVIKAVKDCDLDRCQLLFGRLRSDSASDLINKKDDTVREQTIAVLYHGIQL